MRYYHLAITALLVFQGSTVAREEENRNDQEELSINEYFENNNPLTKKDETQNSTTKVSKDEEQFWDRFLQDLPSMSMTDQPTVSPSREPSAAPSASPSANPSVPPSAEPSPAPSSSPSNAPSTLPTASPSSAPSSSPSAEPSASPSATPSAEPSASPSSSPSATPSGSPSAEPSGEPSASPSSQPTSSPSATPSSRPSVEPSASPSVEPSSPPTLAPSNEPCEVDVTIGCVTADGRQCNELEYPRGECSATQGDLDTLQFQYIPGTCQDSRNDQQGVAICNDLLAINPQIPSVIHCRDFATQAEMTVEPPVVPAGATITVTAPNGAPLPDLLECSIMTGFDTTLQVVTIDTSGNRDLKLFDQFGSLRLESCDNLICVVDATYSYTIFNVGSVEMEITLVERIFNGQTISLLDRVPVNPLPAGESTVILEEFQFNLCEKGEYETVVNVEANPPDGEDCEATDTYNFDITPDCVVDLDMTCTVTGSDQACTDIQGEEKRQCVCSDCPSNMIFRYTGETCSSGAGNKGLLSCSDSNGGPMPVAQISIRDTQGVLYEGMVTVGMNIELSSSGSCIGDVLSVTVSTPGSNDANQQLEINAICELGSDIMLLDSFGSLDFVGYTCRGEDIARNCFIGVTYDVIAENEGKVPFVINEFSMNLNGVLVDFLPRLSDEEVILDEGETVRVNQTAVVERCVDFSSSVEASVEGLADSSNVVCEASEEIAFDIRVGTMFPTVSPSVSPSNEPSASPSAVPSVQPSAQPSSQPSAEPTSKPSAQPSAKPTNQPSAEPTPVPSSKPTTQPSSEPTSVPSLVPSSTPSAEPTSQPSGKPTSVPSREPTSTPSLIPSFEPTSKPSTEPSETPTSQPTGQPSSVPSPEPSSEPTSKPSTEPSETPTTQPTDQPSSVPSPEPSSEPTSKPSSRPSDQPTSQPSDEPSAVPSLEPTSQQSNKPTSVPSATPSLKPSSEPSSEPSPEPSAIPTSQPSNEPTSVPSFEPTIQPSNQPTSVPTGVPTLVPTSEPTIESSSQPSDIPTTQPSDQPSSVPSLEPTRQPTDRPTLVPSLEPSAAPSPEPSAAPSPRPSFQPTDRLTSVPSSEPSAAPSPEPSAEPSPRPSSQPTPVTSDQPSSVPSFEPSVQPTSVPSAVPTLGLSPEPSPQPSRDPTSTPSREGSAAPSSRPTSVPSGMPSPAPSVFPSDMPSFPCVLGLDVQCTLSNGEPCDGNIGNTLCLQRPTSATMLYNGGDCSESDNIQDLLFTCTDFNGGPPTAEGERSWIVVTDIKGLGITYFEGFVGVGQNYRLNDNNERFEADQFISIYRDENTTDPDSLLQLVQYHSSCSSNLELNNRFGASQLTSFFNEAQGNVSIFNAADFTLDIVIPIDIEGDSATLTSLVALTNFAGLIDLSDQVANRVVVPGEELQIIVPATLNLGVAMRYTLLTTLEGIGEFGQQCMGTSFVEFVAGRGALDPTAAPTRAPSISPQPTPDPLLAQCELSASIICESSTGDCNDLQAPSSPRCLSNGGVSELSFLYTGLSCDASNSTGRDYSCLTSNGGPISNPPTDVWMFIRDRDLSTVYFNEAVNFGDVFTIKPISEEFLSERIVIEVSRISSGIRGVALQTINLRTTCTETDDISLLTQYGSLQLTAYRSPDNGYQSAFQILNFLFAVRNVGRLDAIVSRATVDSTLFGIRDVIAPPGVQLQPNVDSTFPFSASLNLYEAAGQTFTNTLSVEGTSVRNDIPCPETVSLDVTVGV